MKAKDISIYFQTPKINYREEETIVPGLTADWTDVFFTLKETAPWERWSPEAFINQSTASNNCKQFENNFFIFISCLTDSCKIYRLQFHVIYMTSSRILQPCTNHSFDLWSVDGTFPASTCRGTDVVFMWGGRVEIYVGMSNFLHKFLRKFQYNHPT